MAKVEYWLQIENRPWDAMPHGINRMTGEKLRRQTSGMFRPVPTDALIIRRYTANWARPDDRPLNPWDLNEPDPSRTQGTIPGATIEAKVGDEIIVRFRNMDRRAGLSEAQRTHSLHPHGVQHSALYDGTYPFSPPDPNQGGKQGDRVAPGDSFEYHWSVPHKATAGTWPYHDHSIFPHHNMRLGAFGSLVIRAPGEQKPDLPVGPVRGPGDSSTHFAALPRPPRRGEYLFYFHELDGVGECLNGRQMLGNTPTLMVGEDTRMTVRCVNLAGGLQTFHIHGHRWRRDDGWVDSEVLGRTSTLTLNLVAGTKEFGGEAGEWLVMSHNSHSMLGSLVVTGGGALSLPSGAMPSMSHLSDGAH
jgi:FtsP/CotA-like multicopper oxidase with cupredoxin domain